MAGLQSIDAGSGAVAVSGGVAAGQGGIAVAGNVYGNIVSGDYNFVVNNNYGTLIYNKPTPAVKLRDAKPQPPRAPLDFVDRANELAQLEQWIGASQPVTLYGPEGAGKTTLLRQSANGAAAQAHPDGVVWLESVDFEGTLLKTNDVVQRLFDALYESTPPLKVTAATARTYLSNIRPLAVLDNLQLPSTDAYQAVVDLFPKSSVLFALPQMPGGNLARSIKLGALPRAEALSLLSRLSQVAITEANRTTLEAICDRLADVPLAISTAANAIREKYLPLERVLATLAAAHPPDPDPLQVGIARAYGLAFLSLSDNERQVLTVAAVSPGISVDPEWVRAMFNTAAWVDPAIQQLQAQGLLHANSPRLRIDPGLRALARQGMPEGLIFDRLIAYLKDQLKTRSLDWEFCADELGNVFGSIEWAARQNRWADVIALSRAINPYLTLHGLWDVWRVVLVLVLTGARATGDTGTEAWARHQIGTRAAGMGDPGEAVRFLRQAHSMRLAMGDRIGAAYTQHNLNILIPPVLLTSGSNGPIPGGLPWWLLPLAIVILLSLLLIPRIIDRFSASPVTPATGFEAQTKEAELIAAATRAATSSIAPKLLPITPTTATPTSSATASTTRTNTPRPTLTVTITPIGCIRRLPSGWEIYTVKRGDTLYTLAPDTGTTVQQLKLANCLTTDQITEGQQLYVPHVPPPTTVTPTPTPVTPSPTRPPPTPITPTLSPPPGPPVIGAVGAVPAESSYRVSQPGILGASPRQACAPSTFSVTASVTSPAGISQVTIDYSYELNGPPNAWYSAMATLIGSNQYQAVIDNGLNNQAAQAMQGQEGQVRWRVVATDVRGQSTISTYNTNKIRPCPQPAKPEYMLDLRATGGGNVTKQPDQASYVQGTVVTLTASANPRWNFTGWSGDLSGSTNPALVTMDGSKVVTATFKLGRYPLAVKTTGDGFITSAAGEISCGNTCLADIGYNTVVTLTATAGRDSNFAGWGGACSGTGTCVVTMDSDKSVTATFAPSGYMWYFNRVSSREGLFYAVDHDAIARTINTSFAYRDVNGTFRPNSYDVLKANQFLEPIRPSLVNTVTLSYYRQDQFAEKAAGMMVEYFAAVKVRAALIREDVPDPTNYKGDIVVTKNPGTPVPAPTRGPGTTPSIHTLGTGTPLPPPTRGPVPPPPPWIPDCLVLAAIAAVLVLVALGLAAARRRRPPVPPAKTFALDMRATDGGNVTKQPDQASYASGTVVTLTATANPGWIFTGWSGDLSGSTNLTTITMDAAKDVTATFAPSG